METSDKSLIYRYGKKPTMKEQGFNEGVRICPHCGKGKQRFFGRFWTPCPVCTNAQPYPKKIRIK